MNAIFRWVFVAAAATLVSCCTPPNIQMVVAKVDGRLRVTLYQEWGIIFPRRRTPCIREAGLYSSGPKDVNNAFWMVQAKGEVQCLDLASFTVGLTPSGFKQVVPLSGVSQHTYSLRVSGIGWGSTEVRL